MMIYFGQELGEEGMDSEGFSGRDGRTTIFDYWSIPSIRRWSNHGRYNLHLLNNKEKEIRHYYQHVLNLCNTEKAIAQGEFFDLMYVNCGGWLMNEHRQYAFLRKYENEVLLIIANFESIPVRIGVNVPQHAFDFLQFAFGQRRSSFMDTRQADYIRSSGIRREDAEDCFLSLFH